jgi:hypothetical protein
MRADLAQVLATVQAGTATPEHTYSRLSDCRLESGTRPHATFHGTLNRSARDQDR